MVHGLSLEMVEKLGPSALESPYTIIQPHKPVYGIYVSDIGIADIVLSQAIAMHKYHTYINSITRKARKYNMEIIKPSSDTRRAIRRELADIVARNVIVENITILEATRITHDGKETTIILFMFTITFR